MKTILQPFIFCRMLISILLLLTLTSYAQNKLTAPGNDSLVFIVIGDWGITGAQAQKAVAAQMNIFSKKHNVQFIITTGDNFYPSGVSGINDTHWKESFEDIYDKEGHQVPWYPVLGNHDYRLNPQAQIDYSSVSKRWQMPSRYYTVKKNLGSVDSVLFAFTDTSPFVTGYYRSRMADLQQQDTAAQLAWLRNTLSASKEKWKIVIGHHPVYSVGAHGNTPELIARFKPVFLSSQTDFYIAGHDHNLQHIVQPGEPLQYLVSGGGGYSTTYPVYPDRQSLFAESLPGFLVMVLYRDNANF